MIHIINVKKRMMLIIVASILLLCVTTGIYFGIKTINHVPYNGITIVLDAGHGGIDGGVVGVTTGVKESDINLSITKILKKIMENKGYKIVLTRSNSEGLYGMATQNRKLKDMQERKRIVENAKPNLLVSIHQNSYPRNNQTGAQVFYSIGGKPDSARTIQYAMNSLLSGTDRVAKKGDYYVLNATKYDSVLVECGFLSTPSEEKLLIQPAYQEKVAYAIYTGINTIFFGDADNEA